MVADLSHLKQQVSAFMSLVPARELLPAFVSPALEQKGGHMLNKARVQNTGD